MILFVELCVSLRKGKPAKDGLYQYKNIAQNTNVQTIEVGYFLRDLEATMSYLRSTDSSETVY